MKTSNLHSVSVGTYNLNPVLREDPKTAVGHYGLLMTDEKNICNAYVVCFVSISSVIRFPVLFIFDKMKQ